MTEQMVHRPSGSVLTGGGGRKRDGGVGGAERGRSLALIAVNHAARWEERRGGRTAVNSDLLPGRRNADAREGGS